jgi:hypothetical protein
VGIEVGVDTRGDPCWHVHRHPFRVRLGGVGTAPIGATDRTAMGLCDRLLVGHFVQTDGGRVDARSGSTDRYQDSPKTSAGEVGVRPGRAPTHTLTEEPAPINGRSDPRCRFRVRPTGTEGAPVWLSEPPCAHPGRRAGWPSPVVGSSPQGAMPRARWFLRTPLGVHDVTDAGCDGGSVDVAPRELWKRRIRA